MPSNAPSKEVRHKQVVAASPSAGTAAAVTGASGGMLHSRLLGSGLAGVTELAIFHPVDTVAKRLMTSKQTLNAFNYNQVLFKVDGTAMGGATLPSVATRIRSLFPGIGFAGVYKISQRTYKFGLQPVLYEAIDRSALGNAIENKPLKNAIAGACLGLGEVALLPLDALKIKAQTNPDSLTKRSMTDIVVREGKSLYRGASWTAARNVPGSFALFGGNSFAKQVMGCGDGKASLLQTAASSMSGAILSLAVSQPLDVIKTRIQSASFSGIPPSGTTIITDILRHEGPGAFFKGFTPKCLAVGPKLIFSFTIAQFLIQALEQRNTAV